MTRNQPQRNTIIRVMAIAAVSSIGYFLLETLLTLQNHQTAHLTSSVLAHQKSVKSLSLPSPKIDNLTFTVPAEYEGKIVYKVKSESNEKLIALTFDDGPWPKNTSKILQILKQNQVKATFFWVGQALQAHPELAKQVVAEGHAIGNHTWHHWYKRLDAATAKSEIERTSELIYKTTGVTTYLFRPPGGFLKNGLATYAKSQKQTVVMWSVVAADTDRYAKPQTLVNNVLKNAKSGDIVLMHDGGGNHQRTVQALPQIITGLKQQGYRFVTIPELLKQGIEAKI